MLDSKVKIVRFHEMGGPDVLCLDEMPFSGANPQLRAQAEKYVFDRLQKGIFRPKIACTFRLDQIVEAHRYMESNEQIGKIVITV